MMEDQIVTTNIEDKYKLVTKIEKIHRCVVSCLLIFSFISVYIVNIEVLTEKDENYYNDIIKNIYIYMELYVSPYFLSIIL